MNALKRVLPWIFVLGLAGLGCGDTEVTDTNQVAPGDGESTADGDSGDGNGNGADGNSDDGDNNSNGDGNSDDGDSDGTPDDDDGDGDEEELIFEDVDPVDCAYPSDDLDCPQGEYGPASFMSTIEIVPDTTCCSDLTGDGQYDNVLGTLVGMLQGVPTFGDVNGNIQDSIDDGQMAYLFEAHGLTHPQWTPSFDLFIHEAGATAYPPAVNLAGEGGFLLRHWSIIAGTGIRRYGFESAYIYDGQLVGQNGTFQIRFPGLLENIDALVKGVTLTADVVQDPAPNLTAGGGFALTNGRLGGAIMRDALYESMNQAAQDCECMGDDVILYYYEDAGDLWRCGLKAEDQDACVGAPIECRSLAQTQLCAVLAQISRQADVVIDGERALSVGLKIETVPTEIMGIQEP